MPELLPSANIHIVDNVEIVANAIVIKDIPSNIIVAGVRQES